MRLLLAFALLLAGCQQAQVESTATDGPTIVSLNPCADAILAEVTAPGQLLAVSHYSHDPAATSMPLEYALQYRATGGTVEEVMALDPDMVVAGAFLPPATRNAFERMGVRVETMGIASTVEDSVAQIRQLAALAGQESEGEVLIAAIAAAMDRSRYDDLPVETLFWQQGGIVPGPDSLIARLMTHTGFASHSAARGLGQGAYVPLEQVLADPPYLVIAAGDERMQEHPVLRDLPGTDYETFNPALLFCGGPTIPRALDRLAEIRAELPSPLPLAGGAGGGPVQVDKPNLQPGSASGRDSV